MNKTDRPELQQVADAFITKVFEAAPDSWPYTELVYAAFLLAVGAVVLAFALNFAGLFIFFERRIAARMQSRLGPNRVGPNGIIQWVADGLKCFLKEDLIPTHADRPLFRIGPYFVVLGMFLAFAAMPFSSALIPADINIGLLFVLGVTSLVVIGFLLSGWGSNSKWALLGGMRSAAQVISYEIPAAIAAMSAIVLAGSLSMQELIMAQGTTGLRLLDGFGWAIFHSPFTFGAFILFFVAQLAEGNRTPFDLPEAESELVSGYNTEYAGMRFLMFFLAEFANVWILCAVSVVVFLGGWQIPWGTLADGMTPAPWVSASTGIFLFLVLLASAVGLALVGIQTARYRRRAHAAIVASKVPGAAPGATKMLLRGAYDGVVAGALGGALLLVVLAAAQLSDGLASALGAVGTGLLGVFSGDFASRASTGVASAWSALKEPVAINLIQLGVFVTKTLILVFVVIQLRWTLPRVRVDQMMVLCWKYLVPLSFVCLIGTLVLDLLFHSVPVLGWLVRVGMVGVTAFVVILYVRRIKASYDVDRENYENFAGESPYFPPWRIV